jgi:hypothetical protein
MVWPRRPLLQSPEWARPVQEPVRTDRRAGPRGWGVVATPSSPVGLSHRDMRHLLGVLAIVGAILVAPVSIASTWGYRSLTAPEPGRTSYVYPVIGPPGDDAGFWCLPENPSCTRDPWWVEWNELQREQLVQYAFVGPGLVTEYRFIEAIWLLWQWPEGKTLLREAAAHGVKIVAAPRQGGAFASYNSSRRQVTVEQDSVEASTWMVTAVLAHELKHAADDRAGARMTERAAEQVEAGYLRWISERCGGLPSADLVNARLSPADVQLYRNLSKIARSSNIDVPAGKDYRESCAPRGA